MHGSLTTSQVERLLRINTLVSLVVDTATWTILDALPRWTESMKDSLENLTVFVRGLCSLLCSCSDVVIDGTRLERGRSPVDCAVVDAITIASCRRLPEDRPQCPSQPHRAYPFAREPSLDSHCRYHAPYLPATAHHFLRTAPAPSPPPTTPSPTSGTSRSTAAGISPPQTCSRCSAAS